MLPTPSSASSPYISFSSSRIIRLYWFSICSMIALPDRPSPPGPSCIVKRSFVATTRFSRRVSFVIARPTYSSELPSW